MNTNYASALGFVLRSEGGFVDNPHDPGGATNKGVTQAVYDGWRRSHGLPTQSVRLISGDELTGIYRLQYWDRIRGDDLPSGVDYAVFDFAVNSGVMRAAEHLQAILHVAVDGSIGGETINAARGFNDKADLIAKICSDRLSFLESLSSFRYFGNGWTVRDHAVLAQADAMA